jgi:hypothetical protein
LRTETSKVPVSPPRKEPLLFSDSAASGPPAVTLPVSVSESLAPLPSSRVSTVAVLAIEAGALLATAASTVIVGAESLPPIGAERSQVTVPAAKSQLQPVPVALE